MKMNDSIIDLRRRQGLLYIMLFSLVTIVVWGAFSVFLSQRSNPIDPQLLKLSAPLNPSIDSTVIEKLKAKKQFSNAELKDFPIYTLYRQKGATNNQVLTIEAARQLKEEQTQESARFTRQRAIESLTLPATPESSPTVNPTASPSGELLSS